MIGLSTTSSADAPPVAECPCHDCRRDLPFGGRPLELAEIKSEEHVHQRRVELRAALTGDLGDGLVDGDARLYGRSDVNASKTSAMEQIRPTNGMSLPPTPCG